MRLIHGECLEEMQKLIDEGVKVDAVICDPPYGTTKCKWDSVIDLKKMWERLNDLIKKNGTVALFGTEPFSSSLRLSNIDNFKYDWIWQKSRPAGHLVAKKRPMCDHENISVFNSVGQYSPQMMPRDKPLNTKKKAGSDGSCEHLDYQQKTEYIKKLTHKYPRTVQAFQNNERGLHPTQKPVALMEYLIKTYTNEGDTVLDFTMGSGTTGVACKNLNRDFIGIELDDKYFNIAKQRIEEKED